MGSYDDKPISQAQYDTLKNLVGYIVEKHKIDLTKPRVFYKECFKDTCKSPLQVNYLPPIITHRDAGNTSCPGNELFKQVQQIRRELNQEQTGKKYAT